MTTLSFRLFVASLGLSIITSFCHALPMADNNDHNNHNDHNGHSVVHVTSHKNRNNCPAYAYCSGSNFHPRIQVNGKFISCNTTPIPKSNCCLPNAAHRVCYDIKVSDVHDGQVSEDKLLNFMPRRGSTNDNAWKQSTVLNELCTAMLKSHSELPGKHIGMVSAAEPGHVIYRYGAWSDAQNVNNAEDDGEEDLSFRHIKHLACSIQSPTRGQ